MVFILTKDGEDTNLESLKYPDYKFSLVDGVWEIEEVKALSGKEKDIQDLDKKLYINDSLVAFGDRFTVKPNFSAKYGDINSYLKLKYKSDQDYDYGNKPIITVSDDSKFYQEIIKIDDNNIILPYNESLYKLKKTDKNIEDKIIEEYQKIYDKKYYSNKTNESEPSIKEAVLLGIRKTEGDPEDNNYTYRTLFLALDEKDEVSLYESNTFIFPRNDGFWKIDESDFSDNKEQTIEIKALKEKNSDNGQKLSKEFPMKILYLDPDYISIKTYLDNGIEEFGTYQIDNFSKNQKLNIEQLGGEDAIKSLENAVAKEASADENLVSIKNIPRYTDIGTEKEVGRLVFQTQFQYNDQKSIKLKNIKIDFVPQIDLTNDELDMSWQSIKNLENDAIDAFSSPDKRVLIVEKSDEFLVYLLKPDAKLIGSVRKGKNDDVIMAEWAEGEYVDTWTEAIKDTDIIPSSFLPN